MALYNKRKLLGLYAYIIWYASRIAYELVSRFCVQNSIFPTKVFKFKAKLILRVLGSFSFIMYTTGKIMSWKWKSFYLFFSRFIQPNTCIMLRVLGMDGCWVLDWYWY